jgi:hypothetical protein
MRNLEQRLERLEGKNRPAGDDIAVICIQYVPHGTLKGFKNDKGFYCERRPGESEDECLARAQELVTKHPPSTPGPRCAIL